MNARATQLGVGFILWRFFNGRGARSNGQGELVACLGGLFLDYARLSPSCYQNGVQDWKSKCGV